MQNSEVVSTLNDLLTTTRDGEEGFRLCAENAKSVDLKSIFRKAASRCDEAAIELRSTIGRLGGEPSDGGSMTGALHRAWTSVKSSVAGMGDHDILVECERGEDVAKEAYKSALDKDLPPEIRGLVQKQFEGVLENHDKIKALRDSSLGPTEH